MITEQTSVESAFEKWWPGLQIMIKKSFIRFVTLRQQRSTRPGQANVAFTPELRRRKF